MLRLLDVFARMAKYGNGNRYPTAIVNSHTNSPLPYCTARTSRRALKSESANALEREKDAAKAAKAAKEKGGASNLVLGVAGGGLALSVPFFLPNLIRLAKKITGSGNPNM